MREFTSIVLRSGWSGSVVAEVRGVDKVFNAVLRRPGLQLLERLLCTWAQWHMTANADGYPPGATLFSGRLSLDVPMLLRDGTVHWHDRLAPVPGTGARSGACRAAGSGNYEIEEAPPLYDRATSELLAAPQAAAVAWRGAAATPGGPEAAKRRGMAESVRATLDFGAATPVVTPSGANGSGAVGGSSSSKRRSLPNGRCFNCGSYGHSLAECHKPYDRVSAVVRALVMVSATHLAFHSASAS